jgi:hypothetical protein
MANDDTAVIRRHSTPGRRPAPSASVARPAAMGRALRVEATAARITLILHWHPEAKKSRLCDVTKDTRSDMMSTLALDDVPEFD